MAQYIIRRLLLMIPTLFGITLLTFCIVRLAPGDPVEAKFGGGGAAGPAVSGGGGGGSANADRTRQIKLAKIALGMMEEKGTVRAWEPSSGKTLFTLSEHPTEITSMASSSSNEGMLAIASKGLVTLWKGDGKKLLGRIDIADSKLASDIREMAFSPDGKQLALAGSEKIVYEKKLKDRPLESYFARVYDVSVPGEANLLKKLVGHPRQLLDISWSANGNLISTVSHQSVFIWDAKNFEQIKVLDDHFQTVKQAKFSLDSKKLVTGAEDRFVYIYDTSTWESKKLKKRTALINCVACSPDSKLLAIALDNRSIQFVDLETYEVIHELKQAHEARIKDLHFSPDSKRLLSGGDDQQVYIWNTSSFEKEKALVGHSDEVTAVSFSPDGKFAFSGAIQVSKVGLAKSYFQWLWRLRKFDFGRSLKDNRPVNEKMIEALPITLKLNLWSILITYIIAIPIGVFAAARRGLFDHLTSVVLFFLYSMPSFWVATLLVLLFGSPSGFSATYFDYTLPIIGLHSDQSENMTYLNALIDHYKHLLLPLVAMTYSSFAFLSRLVRSGMLEGLSQDYVRTARAKGLPPSKVVGVHALRNSMISVVTVFGNILPAMIGGSVIIERIFSIRGMGMLAFDGILQRDYPVIMATTTMAAILTLFGILLSDILYKLVDPRIQLK